MARSSTAPGGYIGGEPPRRPYFNQLSGVWKLDDVVERQKAGLWANPLGIEDIFSTHLYTGNNSTQTITNGIDLAGKGGMVWIKRRTPNNHLLIDSNRGTDKYLVSNNADPQGTYSGYISSFASSGFTIGGDSGVNALNDPYASWTFRKQAKFFDVVTYTGNGDIGRELSHNLGAIPGCIIVKRTDSTGDWVVYHRSMANTEYLVLNTAAAKDNLYNYWNSTTPTSTKFTLGGSSAVNGTGGTYVAYLFAHDATSDGLIQCGSYATDPSGKATVDLGWEPQWLLLKNTTGAGYWHLIDSMRGFNLVEDKVLYPNVNDAEATSSGGVIYPTATGFQANGLMGNSATIAYIAIRRGPMKTPTDATKVFNGVTRTGTGASATVNGFGLTLDAVLTQTRNSATSNSFIDRLRGDASLSTVGTSSESTGNGIKLDVMDGYTVSTAFNPWNNNTTTTINWGFRRAPGFFDVVTYTGTGSLTGVAHNLGVTPELKIIKRRSSTSDWVVGGSILGENAYLYLNTTDAKVTSSNYWDGGDDSSTVFSVRNTNAASDANGSTYIAYLFASCPGVSKVGSYTGTGTTLSIDCGFTNGARFVLIKRTDSTGDWYVWDTARGIVAGSDPYLLLNTTTAENTSTDYIDPLNEGFQISSTAPAAINANGGSFVFLAIA